VMRRSSIVFTNAIFTVKIDTLEGLDGVFVQVQGKSRELVAEAGSALGLDGTYTPHSFIEQVQLSHLMSEFKEATSDFQSRLSLESPALPAMLGGRVELGLPTHRRQSSRGSPERLTERLGSTPDLVLHAGTATKRHPSHTLPAVRVSNEDNIAWRRNSAGRDPPASPRLYPTALEPSSPQNLCRQLDSLLSHNEEMMAKMDQLVTTMTALLKPNNDPRSPRPSSHRIGSSGASSTDFHQGLLTASLTSAAICMSAACAAYVLDKLRR